MLKRRTSQSASKQGNHGLPDLDAIGREVSADQTALSKRLVSGSRVLKIIFNIVGAAMAALGSLALDEWNWPLSPAALLVIVGTISVAVGAIYDLMTTEPPIEALDKARKAVDLAKQSNSKNAEAYRELASLTEISSKLTSLYFSAMSCRGYIEQFSDAGHKGIESSIQQMLDSCAFDLRVALGMTSGDYWTVCVYRSEVGKEGRELRCIADDRAVKCELSNARRWPEGVGVGGVCLSRSEEVTIPDIYDPSVSSAFTAPEGMRSPHDQERYRSMSAVPIKIGNQPRPWGVVLATSSKPRHFDTLQDDEVDVQEGLRMIASFCALLISVHDRVIPKGGNDNERSQGQA